MTKKSLMNKTVSFETKSITEQGVVSGVLNHFGNKDHAGDITVKGAFTKSLQRLKESGRELVVLWQHDHTKPIGVWKNLRETERGLEGEAHLNLDVTLAKEAYALAKQGAVTGFSIGYYVVDEHYNSLEKTNYLREVELIETSLVTFPCNDLSRTEEVKNMKLKGLPTVDELKSMLTGFGLADDDASLICSKYLPDYVSPEEQARIKQEAQEEVERLIREHGLKFEVVAEEEAEDPEATSEEVKDEEQEDDESEEKSDEIEQFFTKA